MNINDVLLIIVTVYTIIWTFVLHFRGIGLIIIFKLIPMVLIVVIICKLVLDYLV